MIGTVEQLQAWAASRSLSIPEDADLLELELDAASSQLSALCCRRLEGLEQDELCPGTGTALLPISEHTAITAVAYGSGAAVSLDSFWTLPLEYAETGPLTFLQMKAGVWQADLPVIVTGTLGYRDPVPADLIMAAYTLVANNFAALSGEIKEVNVLGVAVKLNTPSFQDSLTSLIAKHVRNL